MAEDEFSGQLRHEGPTEKFSQTPLWVIKKCRKSVWLFDFLRAQYGGFDQTFPKLDTIAEEMGVSRNTVKRALADLIAARAMEVRPRYKDDGSRTSNEYVTRFREPKDT
ncbi:helix-turn-helix domain-containing protein [Streptomyces sp. NPDC090442]|uniref:helix-turn-helix domain-containing protein n=1 Tax=Streptomyces sp. NPDC090442 TaxID=3365962 RepID=UPI0038127B8E